MNYLITGGSGLIGLEISKKLLEEKTSKNKIYVLDNKIPNYKKKNFYFINSDIENYKNLKTIIKSKKIDAVLHLAAFLGVKETEKFPNKVIKVNIEGTLNILNACVKSRVKYFLFFSSSEVYGNQKKILKESTAIKPVSIYGLSKYFGENLVSKICKENKISFNIIRLFNIYGKRQSEAFVIKKFVALAKKNKTIQIFGNGKQKRSFCYIKDAINGIIKVMQNGKKNSTYNIGNNKEPISIFKLATKIIKIIKSKSKIVNIPFSKSDRSVDREIFFRIPDISKAKKEINYNPFFSLDKGISKIL